MNVQWRRGRVEGNKDVDVESVRNQEVRGGGNEKELVK